MRNKVVFVQPIKTFFELDSELSGRWREAEREKMAPAAARIDSSLNACDAPAPAETEGNLVGDGGTGLEGSLCQPGLAPAQQRALCTATQLLLLSQRRSRRRGIS